MRPDFVARFGDCEVTQGCCGVVGESMSGVGVRSVRYGRFVCPCMCVICEVLVHVQRCDLCMLLHSHTSHTHYTHSTFPTHTISHIHLTAHPHFISGKIARNQALLEYVLFFCRVPLHAFFLPILILRNPIG